MRPELYCSMWFPALDSELVARAEFRRTESQSRTAGEFAGVLGQGESLDGGKSCRTRFSRQGYCSGRGDLVQVNVLGGQ